MINEIFSMNGFGLYVWSAFSFTLLGFVILYVVIKINLVKEQKNFFVKFGMLDKAKAKAAKTQTINKEILVNTISSKI
tara:strand:- start:689 stop:922 length:234 start_codon:yes stop_codon:yes gene_type:complete